MAECDLDREWDLLRDEAAGRGFDVAWVLDRADVEPGFQDRSHSAGPVPGSPAAIRPDYLRAIVLGSAGRLFWERFRAAVGDRPRPEENPLDQFTEDETEALLAVPRGLDPGAVAAYPFTHPRQILPFQHLIRAFAGLEPGPFGVSLDPHRGPWFAWRTVILTRRAYPVSKGPAEAPCAKCPAPCVAACPAGAADRAGFRWEVCMAHRLGGEDCQTACHARSACPIGQDARYIPEQSAYHYRASLHMLRRMAAQGEPSGARI